MGSQEQGREREGKNQLGEIGNSDSRKAGHNIYQRFVQNGLKGTEEIHTVWVCFFFLLDKT